MALPPYLSDVQLTDITTGLCTFLCPNEARVQVIMMMNYDEQYGELLPRNSPGCVGVAPHCRNNVPREEAFPFCRILYYELRKLPTPSKLRRVRAFISWTPPSFLDVSSPRSSLPSFL